mmetsp:Transcript_7558/g.31970  ORF Transcript_7558/g.31970 Transcript_7558/m.31970 type:complete len:398 (-) Transcript_7558:89-1282(-)
MWANGRLGLRALGALRCLGCRRVPLARRWCATAAESAPFPGIVSADGMKAVVLTGHGPAEDALEYLMLQPLLMGPTDVLVEVHAASINAADVSRRLGRGSRMMDSAAQPLPHVLGQDCSGVVVAAGDRVRHVKLGDEVMGLARPLARRGTHAEYATLASSLVVPKPSNLSHVEAASLPWVSYMASLLQRQARKGTRVLLHGGSGGLGIATLQLLKLKDCHVTVTCSEASKARALRFGADKVVTYDEGIEAIAETVGRGNIDHVVDMHGDRDEEDLLGLLVANGGLMVSLHLPFLEAVQESGMVLGGLKTIASTWKRVAGFRMAGITFHYAEMDIRLLNQTGMVQIASWTEGGQLKPDVATTYPLSEAVEAHEHFEAGRAGGKIVLNLDLEREPRDER